ncbi:hypothetical protein LGH83_06335 [Lichenihabitans sp. PAMC28606]|uniref:hypothetical protein n=1 Tax=Lichenihabitans sp. PAMC28606 TaxID=2880932 RepID=UPI001D09CD4E|nr:hypothetical protein [Lichenihabitans sp. PAMC28606]UDL95817.1 hypothetical protein LGH83_06335 [Lichenihabitans sp. PAMC28606]
MSLRWLWVAGMGEKLKAVLVPAPLPQPGPRTKAAIANAEARSGARQQRVGVKIEKRDGVSAIGSDHADLDGHTSQLLDAFGSSSVCFATAAVDVLSRLSVEGNQIDSMSLNASLALVDGIRPQDELEGALATQIAASHALSLKMLRKASSAIQIDFRDSYINAATKLSRTMVAQVEALAKLRRGGEQSVFVKHVHVHDGGQAIVGNVTGGAGGRIEKQGQSDARTVQHAEMRCEDALGELLPLAGRGR